MLKTSSNYKAKLVSGLFILGILYFLFLPPISSRNGPQAMIKAKQSEAEFYVKNMNRSQRSYRIEYGLFTTEFSGLNTFSTMPEQTNSYVYRIVPSAELDTQIMHLAVAKQPDLRSYIGAVVAISHDRTISIVCESKRPSQTAPLTPKFMNGLLVCASGSSELK